MIPTRRPDAVAVFGLMFFSVKLIKYMVGFTDKNSIVYETIESIESWIDLLFQKTIVRKEIDYD